jgi:hypothetical protein
VRVIRVKNLKLTGVQDNRDSDESANPGIVAQFVLDGGCYEAVLDTDTLPKGEFEFAIVPKSKK